MEIGDAVYWKGILLMVEEIKPNGEIIARNPRMQVVVSDESLLEKTE